MPRIVNADDTLTRKPGEPRSKVQTISSLDQQLGHILAAVPSNAGTAATETGTKDKFFQFFAKKLSAYYASLKAKSASDPSLRS